MLDMDNIESDEYSRRLKLFDGLRSALRTLSTKSFAERFIELDGLTRLLEFLVSMNTGAGSIRKKSIKDSFFRLKKFFAVRRCPKLFFFNYSFS